MSQWELAVIGTALGTPASLEEAGDLLPTDFTGKNQVVWATILGLHNNGRFDTNAVRISLESDPEWKRQLSDAGNTNDYLREALSYRGVTMQTYADKVLEASIKRAVRRSAALIAITAEEEGTSADEVLDYAEKQVMQLRRTRMNEGTSLGDILSIFITRLDGMLAGTVQPAWTPAVTAVKNVIDFLEGTDFFVIGGRPGEGKSSYLRVEHHALSVKDNIPSAIINMENDPIEYARYMIAMDTGLDSRKLKNPALMTRQEIEMVKTSAQTLATKPLKIVTMAAPSVAEVARVGRKLVQEMGIKLLGVDYIQLVRNGIEKRVDDVAVTTAGLRAFALGMNVPVLAASQLNRAIETRNNGADDPMLSDLRESGSLEQDATIVAFIRGHWRNPTEAQLRAFPENVVSGRVLERPKAIPVRFHFAKNRNGEAGVSDIVKWNKGNGRFQTLVRDVA